MKLTDIKIPEDVFGEFPYTKTFEALAATNFATHSHFFYVCTKFLDKPDPRLKDHEGVFLLLWDHDAIGDQTYLVTITDSGWRVIDTIESFSASKAHSMEENINVFYDLSYAYRKEQWRTKLVGEPITLSSSLIDGALHGINVDDVKARLAGEKKAYLCNLRAGRYLHGSAIPFGIMVQAINKRNNELGYLPLIVREKSDGLNHLWWRNEHGTEPVREDKIAGRITDITTVCETGICEGRIELNGRHDALVNKMSGALILLPLMDVSYSGGKGRAVNFIGLAVTDDSDFHIFYRKHDPALVGNPPGEFELDVYGLTSPSDRDFFNHWIASCSPKEQEACKASAEDSTDLDPLLESSKQEEQD